MHKPVKKTFIRFFGRSQLFSDGYSPVIGNSIPALETPVLEVRSRELPDLDFWVPDGAVGFTIFNIITTLVDDNGQAVPLTSGEINCPGRYFFQLGDAGRDSGGIDFGRIMTRDGGSGAHNDHTYMRRYCHAPLPDKIILYSGPRRPANQRWTDYYICTFDFLQADQVVPLFFCFPLGHMLKAAAEKRGWVKRLAA